MSRRHSSLLCVLAIMVGLNLRPALAALGPLLDAIQTSTGLSFKAAGLAISLPITAMGILALGGASVYRLGMRRGIGFGLSMIVAACVIRLAPDSQEKLLLITALIAGLGIGLVQTFMPGFIKPPHQLWPGHACLQAAGSSSSDRLGPDALCLAQGLPRRCLVPRR